MKKTLAIPFAAAALLAAPVVMADTSLGLRFGSQGDYELAGASLRFSPRWSSDWGNWKATLHPEAELGQFRYRGDSSGPEEVTQIGGGAALRLVRGAATGLRPYAEVGLMAALFSHDEIGARDLGTTFQFGEYLGLGIEFGERYSLGWRYSHYSNGGIKQPNEGVDMHQLMFGVRF